MRRLAGTPTSARHTQSNEYKENNGQERTRRNRARDGPAASQRRRRAKSHSRTGHPRHPADRGHLRQQVDAVAVAHRGSPSRRQGGTAAVHDGERDPSDAQGRLRQQPGRHRRAWRCICTQIGRRHCLNTQINTSPRPQAQRHLRNRCVDINRWLKHIAIDSRAPQTTCDRPIDSCP